MKKLTAVIVAVLGLTFTAGTVSADDMIIDMSVSYTHLTLPTIITV